MTDTRIDICMVGSAMTDLTVRVPRLPEPGETVLGSRFTEGFGGKGSNQAVMAARLGAKVSVVVKLGRDSYGDKTLQNYQNEGIDTAFVGRVEGASGIALITVAESGENVISLAPGANSTLSPEDVEKAEAAVRGAAVLIAQLETPLDATLAAFRLAKRGATRTILNPAPAAELPAELLSLTDILIPNEVEAGTLLGRRVETLDDAREAAGALLELGPEIVVLTLGGRGALLAVADTGPQHIPVDPVKVVDTTGAGDAFVGSLAYFLACQSEVLLSQAVTRACRLAALTVEKPGAQSSYPNRADATAALRSTQLKST